MYVLVTDVPWRIYDFTEYFTLGHLMTLILEFLVHSKAGCRRSTRASEFAYKEAIYYSFSTQSVAQEANQFARI